MFIDVVIAATVTAVAPAAALALLLEHILAPGPTDAEPS